MNINEYPTGYITIVYTDIVGSSEMARYLNDGKRDLYETALRDPHRDRLFALLEAHRGFEIGRAGDGHLCVFQEAWDAVQCMKAFQESLRDDPLRVTLGEREFVVQVRIGIHTCERSVTPKIVAQGGGSVAEYPTGSNDFNFGARVSAIGDGGQILLSHEAFRKAQPEIGNENVKSWPRRYLKSFAHEPQTVHELLYFDGQEPQEPGMRFFSGFVRDESNHYVTREAEETEVITRFVRQEHGRRPRLVTVHAEGGMGKTRLAIACCLRVADAFADEIHFVKLSDTPPGAYALAEAIGGVFGKSGTDASPDAVCALLEGKQLLLLLDNYESCANADAAQFVRRLLDNSGVHLLVTSRVPVGVTSWEKRVPLEKGLTYEQAKELFLERAALNGEEFGVLRDGEEDALRRVLRLVSVEPEDESSGPIPLAVELAAAWRCEKELAEIADGLEKLPLDRFTGPVSEDDAAEHERHKSLRRSLDWSFDLLGDVPGKGARLQSTFTVCGLFPSLFDAADVQTFGRDAETDDLLILLHRASMLQKRPDNGRTFYRLHRFTREYARLKLSELPDGAEFIKRYIAHYADLAKRHKDINSKANRDALEVATPNAIAAVEWAAHVKDWNGLAGLWTGLLDFLDLRSMFAERELLFGHAVALTKELGLRQDEGSALNNLGMAYYAQERWAEAEVAYRDGLKIWHELGNRVNEGTTLNNLGAVYDLQGRPAEAEAAHQDSLKIARELGDRANEGRVLNNLGTLYEKQERWAEAAAAYQNSLAICRECGDKLGEGITLNNLGNVYDSQGRPAEAEEAYQDSLEIAREYGDRVNEGLTLRNLALLWARQNEFAKALPYARGAVAALKTTQSVTELAAARRLLALIEADLAAGG